MSNYVDSVGKDLRGRPCQFDFRYVKFYKTLLWINISLSIYFYISL
jgi:hypothetical protein